MASRTWPESHLTVDNSGSFAVSALGEVTGTNADAEIRAGGFIQQSAVGYEEASVVIDNSGELDVSANALANGEVVNVMAIALGASQVAAAYSDAFGAFVNSGDLSVSVTAEANADYYVELGALAIGAQQQGFGDTVNLGMENSGELSANIEVDMGADAKAALPMPAQARSAWVNSRRVTPSWLLSPTADR